MYSSTSDPLDPHTSKCLYNIPRRQSALSRDSGQSGLKQLRPTKTLSTMNFNIVNRRKGLTSKIGQETCHHFLKLPFKQHNHETSQSAAAIRKYTLQFENQQPEESSASKREKFSSRSNKCTLSIDYSPRSGFLQKLKAQGEVIKKCSRAPVLKRLVASPANRKIPRTRDIGTDPPNFDLDFASKAEQQQCNYKPVSTNTKSSTATSACSKKFSCLPPGFDVLCGLERNKRQGRHLQNHNALNDVKDFRLSHWADCHGEPSSLSLSNHTCTHQYNLNERMLAHPSRCNLQGDSLCSQCGLRSSENNPTKHELFLDPSKKKAALIIPDPRASRPVLRSTVESRNKTINILSVPTLSYVPHAPQRVARHLCSKQTLNVGKKVITHTINCQACATATRDL